jgi:hypothetical protein
MISYDIHHYVSNDVSYKTSSDIGGFMFETPEERIKLLKAGIPGKTIEMLYIKNNNFRIIGIPAVIELVELDILAKKKMCKTSYTTAEHTAESQVHVQEAT